MPVAFSRIVPAGRLKRTKIGPLNSMCPALVSLMVPLQKSLAGLWIRPYLVMAILTGLDVEGAQRPGWNRVAVGVGDRLAAQTDRVRSRCRLRPRTRPAV